MGALVAGDVILTKVRRTLVGLMKYRIYTVAFGDGEKTYPANGVPLPPLASFRMKRVDFHEIAPVTIDGYKYVYDKAYHTIRKFQVAGFTPAGTAAGHTHNILLKGGITATEPVAVEGGDTLGKNAATDRTIAGADSATKGGVAAAAALALTGTAVAAAPLSEVPTSHAPAATTLTLKLQGK